MEALECRTNGYKFDLGTGETLKNFGKWAVGEEKIIFGHRIL